MNCFAPNKNPLLRSAAAAAAAQRSGVSRRHPVPGCRREKAPTTPHSRNHSLFDSSQRKIAKDLLGPGVAAADGATRTVERPTFGDTRDTHGARDCAISPWEKVLLLFL